MRSHAEHSTTSEGKLRSEAFIATAFNPNAALAKGFLLGVMGCDEGAARHVQHFEACGYPETRQIVIDRDPKAYARLNRWAEENNYLGRVLHGTFEELLPQLRAEGYNITTIDADVCGLWGKFEEHMIKAILETNVPRLALTFTLRGYTNYHEELGYRLGLLPAERIPSGHCRTPKRRRMRDSHYPMRLLAEQHCKSLLRAYPNYQIDYFSYRGAGTCNMGTVCISNKGETR